MDRKTFSWLRRFSPAVLALAFVTPFFLAFFVMGGSAGAGTLAGLGLAVAAYIIGDLYNAFSLRELVLRPSQQRVDDKIKNALLDACSDMEGIREREEELRKGDTLTQVFYWLVDNDQSLKERAQRLYASGLIWTGLADVIVLGVLAAFGYFILSLILRDPSYHVVALVCLLVALITSRFAFPLAVERHVRLADDQLDHIRVHEREALCERLREVGGGAV